MTRRCSFCHQEITLTAFEPNLGESLREKLSNSEIACAMCVRQLGQHPDDPYVVLLGAYYRKIGNAYVKIAPAGAFHG